MPQVDHRQGTGTSTVYGRVGVKLARKVKAIARTERRSVNDVIIMALERYVAERQNGRARGG